MNNITLHGKLMDDFKVQTVGQSSVAKATLIVDRGLYGDKKKEAQEKGYPTADFPKLELWGSEARINLLTNNVKKGDKLLVKGFIQTGSYEKDGKKIYTTVINVQDFDFEFKQEEEY